MLLFLGVLVGCESALPTATAPTLLPDALPVIIDTDGSVDAWISIPYLLQRPEVDVQSLINLADALNQDPALARRID